ncbi:hypothetical protein RQP46_010572 [Phenoliferia psychrophenolica]
MAPSVARFLIKPDPDSDMNHLTAFRQSHLAILSSREWSFLHSYCLSLYFAPQGVEILSSYSDAEFNALLDSCEQDHIPHLDSFNAAFASSDPLPFPPALLAALKESGESDENIQSLLKQGHIAFRGHLDVVKKGDKSRPAGVYVQLDVPALAASCRFTRLYGSQSFLRIKIHKNTTMHLDEEAIGSHVRALLDKPLDVVGSRFEGYWSSEEDSARSVYMYAPDVTNEKSPQTLARFFNEHIDLSVPSNQLRLPFPKALSRFGLGHSATVPTIIIAREDVQVVPDLEYDTLQISYPVLEDIAKRLQLKWLPSCIEGHVNGRRETFALEYTTWPKPGAPTTTLPDRWIELYRSSTKMQSINIVFKTRNLRRKDPSSEVKYVVNPAEVTVRWQHRNLEREREDPDRKLSVMSDGAMQDVRVALNEQATPTCIQFRLGGAKGMLTTPPRQDDRRGHFVELRPSQLKYFDKVSASFQLEVLKVANPEGSGPVRIGKQPLEVLSNGGVPNSVFEELFKSQVKPVLDVLIQSFSGTSQSSLITLDAVFSTNGMIGQRHGQISRNINPQSLRLADIIAADEGQFGDPHEYLDGSLDPYSLAPNTLPEFCVSTLLAGIEPGTDPVLTAKLKTLGENALQRIVLDGQLTVCESCTFRVTIDVAGVLQPNEISIRFSEARKDPRTGFRFTMVTGDVLVFRSPCMAASDVRKVTAVDHPELAHRLDEIVVSRHDPHRSLLSLLSGGDFDGDTVTSIWDPAIVASFRDADTKWADPPFNDSDFLEVDRRSVKDALLVKANGEIDIFNYLQKMLEVGSAQPPEWATKWGAADSRLKTGSTSTSTHRRKGKDGLPLHVADALLDAYQAALDDFRGRFYQAIGSVREGIPMVLDADFLHPWIQATTRPQASTDKSWQADLAKIYEHVKSVKDRYNEVLRTAGREKEKDQGINGSRLSYKSKLRPVSAALWEPLDELAGALNSPLLTDAELGRPVLRRLVASTFLHL